MESKQFKVTLYVYDLTGGAAKALSPMFLGKQIDGVWHTSIVVFGKQYYFGGGICVGQPKNTPYGFPVKEEQLGQTEITMDVFQDFLQSINNDYTINTYDLFQKNCNHFSNECSQFLLDQKIPDYISNLPKEILDTPIGKMFQPMIDQMQQAARNGQGQLFPQMVEGSSNTQSMNPGGLSSSVNPPVHPSSSSSAPGSSSTSLNSSGSLGVGNTNAVDNQMISQLLANLNMGMGMGGGGSGGSAPAPPMWGGMMPPNPGSGLGSGPFDWKKVKEISDQIAFFDILQQQACVIQFHADWCGPCQKIKPVFANLSQEFQKINPSMKFYSVNSDKLRDLCMELDIKAYPTFLFYLQGEKHDLLKGANDVELRQKIEKLVDEIQSEK